MMFKRSRIKIIASIMAALLLFLIVALAVIYGTSYMQIQSENAALLEQFSERFSLADRTDPQGSGGMPPEFQDGRPMEGTLDTPDGDMNSGPGGDRNDRRRFDVSTFYFIALSSTGEVLASDYGGSDTITEDYLVQIAEAVSSDDKVTGQTDGMIYRVTDKGDYTLVAFMDNSVIRGNMGTLLRNTLIAFALSVVVVFLLSLYLSRRIIAPLEDNDQRQKQFISDAGHELKTPIAVMSANLELLEQEIGENTWLDNIEYENSRMSMLVKQLLELSHAESDVMIEEDIDMSVLVEGEALPFEGIAFDKGLLLNYNIRPGVHLKGNPTQLRQLTAILIDNAISHSEGGNDILLSLNSDKKSAVLKVTNYGKEIPLDKRDKLFERFYRMDEARTSDSENHYGLGLAIAKAITQSHNGTISIDCNDGKVTFTVELPIKK